MALIKSRAQDGVSRVVKSVTAAVEVAFNRIRGIIRKAKARFSAAIPRTRARITDIAREGVSRAKKLTSIEGLKAAASQIKQNIADGEVLKYFKSKQEFLKLVDPITKRFHQLVRRMTG